MKFKARQQEQAVYIAVGVAMCLLCYSLIIRPAFQDIFFLRQEVSDSQKRLDLYQEIGDMELSLANFEKSLATVQDRSALLSKISDFANQSQINIQTLTPRTEPDGIYSRLSISLEGKGSFFSLLKFFKMLETGSTSISVGNISLLRQSSVRPGEEKYPLQVQIGMTTLLKQRAK